MFYGLYLLVRICRSMQKVPLNVSFLENSEQKNDSERVLL